MTTTATITQATTVFGQGLARVRWTCDTDDLASLVTAMDAVELMEESVGSDGFTSRKADVHGVLALFPSCHTHEENLMRGCAAPVGAVSRRHARAALAAGATKVSAVSSYIATLPWYQR